MKKDEQIRMLVIWPDGNCGLIHEPADLNTMQGLVGGFIEPVSPAEGSWHAWINDEGKNEGLPVNPYATNLARKLGWVGVPGDELVGPVVFVGDSPDGNDVDVPAVVLEAFDEITGGGELIVMAAKVQFDSDAKLAAEMRHFDPIDHERLRKILARIVEVS